MLTDRATPPGPERHRRARAAAALTAGVAVLLAGVAAAGHAGPPRSVAATAPASVPVLPHQEKVLVLKYFPLTPDGQYIDIGVTGDVSGPLATLRAQTDAMTANVADALTRGTEYHGYADPAAQPSLTYQVIGVREYLTKVPTIPNPTYNPPSDPYRVRPDYPGIAATINICDYVQNQGVDEVWMWAYQGPSQLAINESKMAGPHGDQSNSSVHGDLPACNRTYTWYTFNYGRGTAEAVHSHSHQLEVELNYLDRHTFTDLFEGTPYPGNGSAPGRCGSVHNPPNATSEYDWANPTPHASDCLNWTPVGTGALTQISCATWTCSDTSDTNNSQLNYLVWWMRNFPGAGNQITLGGRPMRNWWEVHADFDAAVDSGTGLVEPPAPSPSPTPGASGPAPSGAPSTGPSASAPASPTPSPSPTGSPAPGPQFSFEDGTLSGWSSTGHITSITNSSAAGGQNGARALQLTLHSTGSSDLPYAHVNPAGGPTAGQTLTAYLYRPAGASTTVSAKLYAVNPSNSSWMQGNLTSVGTGAWVALRFTLPSFSGSASQIGVQFLVSPSNTDAIVYLDSVAWS
jgi:Mannanase, galactose-binding domain-like